MKEAAAKTYRNSLREMQFVAGCWVLAFLWTVGFCYLHGYEHSPNSWVVRNGLAEVRNVGNFRHVMGFPDWVAYGIIAPWLVCSTVTVIYGFFGMKDDDLGTEGDQHGA
jgi:hypothetical protein